MRASIAVNTLAFSGYEMEEVLDEIAAFPGSCVEPALIEAYYGPSIVSELSEERAHRMSRRLKKRALQATALAAHMDLGQRDSVERFKKRMEYASIIGAQVVNTNSTNIANSSVFFRNMEKIVSYAEHLDLKIGLENPGAGRNSIMGTGVEGVDVVRTIGSPAVGLNYDCGNVVMYTKARIRPEQELEHVAPHLVHVHLKDMRPFSEGWEPCAIGKGIVPCEEVLQFIAHNTVPCPMSIELPLRFWWNNNYEFVSGSPRPVPDLSTIRRVYEDSFHFINRFVSPQRTGN